MVDLNLSIVEQGIKSVMAEQIKNREWPWIREIKTYGGEFDDETLAFVKTFPAIWVTYQGSTSEKTSHNKTEYKSTFVVLVGAHSLRNEESQRHSVGADIGTYEMLDRVQRLLSVNDLSSQNIKGLAPLEMGKTRTIFNTTTRGQSISVLAQEFTTQYVIQASDRDREEAETDAMLTHVNFNYYFDPKDYGITEADASDLVKLKE
ncbi:MULTISPECIES: phage protein Gp37 [unclassified Acinetobacter]|uniref:phage protein Gp37 n=1 Tax=unclassified Acinetobacter TaxID=196816 RepID=UPI00190B47B4|nr:MULTISPECIES: phage protein Gp37 [unclassified Acinetobacter]MBK0063964.1 DUF1834 family protein [Acinetobacter sp. S55]MBK0067249.1 DUF1834 family protein [Acinetobacter sp. S54]